MKHLQGLLIAELRRRRQHDAEELADLVITQTNGAVLTDPAVDFRTHGWVVVDIGPQQPPNRQIAHIEELGRGITHNAAHP